MNQKQRYPCGQTRREAVWKMGCGFTGLALAELLVRDSLFGLDANAQNANPSNPIAQDIRNFADGIEESTPGLRSLIQSHLESIKRQLDAQGYTTQIDEFVDDGYRTQVLCVLGSTITNSEDRSWLHRIVSSGGNQDH